MYSNKNDELQSVFEHFGDLRKKIFIALGAFIFCSVFAHIFHKEIIAFLLKPIGDQHLIFLSPLDPLFFIFKIDFITGFILSFPVIAWCIFSFITPALSEKTSKLILIFYFASFILLFLGLFYAFFITIPFSIEFLSSINISGIENNFSVDRYLDFFITQALIITIVFQIPVLIIGGIFLGILKNNMLANKRRIIYFSLLVALAVITPTTDIFSLSIIFLPCIAIFELSFLGGKIVEFLKKQK